MKIVATLLFGLAAGACNSDLNVHTEKIPCPEGKDCATESSTESPKEPSKEDEYGGPAAVSDGKTEAAKYSTEDCVDPDLTQIPSTVSLSLCDGTLARGSFDLSQLAPANIRSGVTIAGILGTAALESHNDCMSDGASNCVVDGTNFKVVSVANILAGNIRSGVTIAGVLGTGAMEGHTNCAADGAVGCVTTNAFKAADLASFASGDIKSGKVIAGVSGAINHCSDGESGCFVMGPGFLAASSSNVAAANIKSGVTIAGTAGTYGPACTADGGSACLVDGTIYKAAKLSNFAASDVKTGVTIAGVSGLANPNTYSNCSADGEEGCIATTSYPAAEKTQVTAGNIKSGVVIAGVTGTYPSGATPLAGATGTTDLTSFAATTAAGAYEFFDSAGVRHTGSIADAGTIMPGSSDQTFNSSLYRQFTVAGDSALSGTSIKTGVTLFGVAGTLAPAPANCAANAEVGCVTTAAFKAADFSNITVANIKKNVVVAGVTGDYPSATHRLVGADATTDLPAFAATAGATTYEWFTSDGTRVTDAVEANETVSPGTANQTLNAGLYRSVTVNGDSDLTDNNIKSGVNIFGVAGTVTPSAADCAANGEVGCVTTSTFKAADLTNLVSGNIKNGISIAGTTGTYPSLSSPLAGATGTSDLISLDASTAVGNYEFFDSTGARYVGAVADAGTVTATTSDQIFNAAVYRGFTVAGDSDLAATNIKSGVTIFATAGTLAPAPANCAANAEVGCVTTATFKAADLSNLTAANIKKNVVVAGVTGDYPSATHRLAGADATTDLPAFASTTGGASYEWFTSDGTRLTDAIEANETVTPGAANQTLNAGLYRSITVNGDADLVAGNVKDSVTIFGVTGNVVPSAAACSSDGEVGCVTTASYKAANMTNVIAGNIKDTVVIAGVTGNLSGTPANCSSNGEMGCVTTATYKAADLTNLLSGNIKNGVTIAGTAGTYPSLASPLAGATGTSDLTSMAATAAAGSYEFFDSTGTRYTGTITDAGTVTAGTSNQAFTASLYRQFTVAGDADLVAGNIKAGIDILGVTGTVTAAPANCSANAEVGCVTTSTYKAADLSNLVAGNIRNGVALAGVTGNYPSATSPLAGSDATVDLPAFSSTTGGATYEWFKSDGSRLTGTITADASATPSASAQTFNTGLYRSVTVAGDANLVAGNISSGVTIFGVTGTVTPSPANCSANGTVGCVTTATYKSADLTNLLAANIKNGVTIAGTAGTYPSLATPLAGATGTSDLVSMAASAAAGSYEFFDSTGTRYTGAITDAGTVTASTSDQSFTTSLYRQFTVAGDVDLVAGNIKSGIDILGVTGNVTPSPANCSADNQTGCVTTATYKSADTGAFVASDLKSGKTVAGVAGSLANCSADGAQGCVTTASYKAANMTNVTAANIKSGVTIAGQLGDYPSATNPLAGNTATTDLPGLAATTAAGSYEWFKSDGTLVSGSISNAGTITPGTSNQTFNTSVYRQFTVNGDANLVAGNIKNAISIFGVTGNVSAETHSNCSGNAQQGCVTTATYQSADLTNLAAGNIKNGVTIAGTAGNYPSVTSPLVGNTGTTDLPGLAATTAAGSYEWFKSDGSLVSGSISDAGTITPGTSNQTFSTSVYRQFTVNGDADLVVGNIKSGVDIFGVTGNVAAETHSNCTGNAQTGCVTTATYKSGDLTNLSAANIRSGVTIAGTAGGYPSATNRLAGADATADLDSATFNAKIKASADFEWFDSAGTRYTQAGEPNITGGLILSGASIFGTAGTYVPGGMSASGLSAASGASKVVLSWTRSGGTGVIIVRRAGASVTWVPSSGTSYSVGSVDANHEVVYKGTASTADNTNVTSATTYYYKAFVYNADNGYSAASTEASVGYMVGEICGGAGDGCYDDTAAMTAGTATTPLGKSLVYVTAGGSFKVWKDASSNKILRPTGLDAWAMNLNLDGKGLLAAGNEFTAYTNIVGRVCPTNVYIDDSNKFTTGNCLYYTNQASSQALSAAGTSQTVAASIGLAGWNTYDATARWYVGNIKTCSDMGMRLPTIFESSTTSTSGVYDPDADGTPTFATSAGVPAHASGYTWTATASRSANTSYNRWNTSGTASSGTNTSSYYVRCVLP